MKLTCNITIYFSYFYHTNSVDYVRYLPGPHSLQEVIKTAKPFNNKVFWITRVSKTPRPFQLTKALAHACKLTA
jgi:hypothetical protein